MPNPLAGLQSTAEVCKALHGIDRSTLSRWVSNGRITPVFRLPGRNGGMYFDPADVARLAATLKHEAAA